MKGQEPPTVAPDCSTGYRRTGRARLGGELSPEQQGDVASSGLVGWLLGEQWWKEDKEVHGIPKGLWTAPCS